jgi:hypothetical protein
VAGPRVIIDYDLRVANPGRKPDPLGGGRPLGYLRTFDRPWDSPEDGGLESVAWRRGAARFGFFVRAFAQTVVPVRNQPMGLERGKHRLTACGVQKGR